MNELLVAAASVVSTFATALITWFFARKKQRTELKSSQTDLEIKLTDKYEKLLDSFDKRLRTALDDLDRATNAIRERDKQIDELTKELRLSDKKIDDFIAKVQELTDELKKYKQLNGKQP